MTEYRYTLLCEGISDKAFIVLYFDKLKEKHNVSFLRNPKDVIKQSASPSKSKVLSKVALAFAERTLVGKENFLVVGVDVDEQDLSGSATEELRNKILSQIRGESNQKKLIIFLPVRAIDYWISYSQDHGAKRQTIRSNSLESKEKEEIKKLAYGDKKADEITMKNTVTGLASIFDIDTLVKQSLSFAAFHNRVMEIVKPPSKKKK